jgi:hypothetical protein
MEISIMTEDKIAKYLLLGYSCETCLVHNLEEKKYTNSFFWFCQNRKVEPVYGVCEDWNRWIKK